MNILELGHQTGSILEREENLKAAYLASMTPVLVGNRADVAVGRMEHSVAEAQRHLSDTLKQASQMLADDSDSRCAERARRIGTRFKDRCRPWGHDTQSDAATAPGYVAAGGSNDRLGNCDGRARVSSITQATMLFART